MHLPQHPANLLDQAAVTLIRQDALTAEQNGALTPAQLELIHKKRWFQVLVPASAGGLEWTMPEVVRLFEALAWADGALGWCVNLGAGANIFAGYLLPETAGAVFANPAVSIAGSGATTGTARKNHDGYIATGSWKYASGAAHATHFTANCYIVDDYDIPLQDDKGEPLVRSFLFRADQVKVLDTWNSYGLKASSSHDFEVHEQLVPEQNTFTLTGPSAYAGGPLYHFPFLQMAELNMAAMLTGMALHFIDAFNAMAQVRKPYRSDIPLADQAMVKTTLQHSAASLEAARSWMYAALHDGWKAYEQQGTASAQLLQVISSASQHAAQVARQVVQDLYPFAGMAILNPENELNKIWRDLHTASQHVLVSPLHHQNTN
jgi:alkylation response protein AidB-like acyl-CoA dehydrogenase